MKKVQARIGLVLEKFEELEVAKAVVRYLRRPELRLPSRPLRGPAPVECLVLAALEPDRIELVLAALVELEQEYAALKRKRELHLERLRVVFRVGSFWKRVRIQLAIIWRAMVKMRSRPRRLTRS